MQIILYLVTWFLKKVSNKIFYANDGRKKDISKSINIAAFKEHIPYIIILLTKLYCLNMKILGY